MHDSVYEKLVMSEHIEGAYEAWSSYRKDVTKYIIDGFSCLSMQSECPVDIHLCNIKKKKPVICIFGAGESNDIDLRKLAAYCDLILVDHNRKSLELAKWRYGLDENVILADIPFWRIEDESYRMFEALLADGAEKELVLEYLSDVADANSGEVYIPDRFMSDVSVAIGIHSQLVSRFAALLYSYRENYDEEDLMYIENAISALNKVAVERLNDVMYHVSSDLIIYGYEIMTLYDDIEKADRIINEMMINKKYHISNDCMAEGAKQLMKDISLHKDCDIKIINNLYLPWNFLSGEKRKTYIMELMTCEKLE